MKLTTVSLFLLVMMSLGWAQTKQDTLNDLMRKVEILTREIEKQKLGEVAERKYESKYGLGPAASQIYHKPDPGVSIAGYGEVVYENYADKKDDDSPGGRADQIDYLRNIIYVGYRYNDRFLFNAEIEFEHALAGDGKPGEVAMEFGYVDAMLIPELTFRAGMVLVPIGIINEFHEPSTFFGALRPETERHIIPTTWRANGMGFVGGTASGIGYRAYILEGLNAAKFSASGIRSGRQSGARAVAENLAFAGRAEYTGFPGLNIGASFYTGNSGQGLRDSLGSQISSPTTILAVHAMLVRSGFEVRALYARSSIGDVVQLNDALGFAGGGSIGEEQFGYYVTFGYDVLQLLMAGSEAQLQPFIQYEKLDTQHKVPGGFSRNPANEKTNLTLGVMYKPISNVGFKLDYIDRDNEAGNALDQFNIALTYLF